MFPTYNCSRVSTDRLRDRLRDRPKPSVLFVYLFNLLVTKACYFSPGMICKYLTKTSRRHLLQ